MAHLGSGASLCALRALESIDCTFGFVSNDVRDLLESDVGATRLAVDYFIYRVAQEVANAANASRLSRPEGAVAVWMIPTNEELMIARHTARLLAAEAGC